MFHKAIKQDPNQITKELTPEEKQRKELLIKIDNMKQAIEKQKKRRTIEYWIPDKILCRRFNVPQPENKTVKE
jgi:hypothetical protein